MVVGTGFPVIGSGVVLGTDKDFPSTLMVMVSTGGGAAGLFSVVGPFDILLAP
jgi:hypothetical protein